LLPDLSFRTPGLAIGVAIPHYGLASNADTIDASVDTAERLGWRGGAWVQDHLLVGHDAREPYGRVYESIVTLAYVAGRTRSIALGCSVLVPPMRDAILLAKELSGLDALSRGRLVVGVGSGWNRHEFANLGHEGRFEVRGGYLDDTIALWRHLWAGRREPFKGGQFELGDDYEFAPLPERPGGPPIWVGGRSAPAYRRAGRVGDGFHSGELMRGPEPYAEAVAAVERAAMAAGRTRPVMSARINIRFGRDHGWQGYAVDGTSDEIASRLAEFRALGVSHLVCNFGLHDPTALARAMERFDAEVLRRLPDAG
jgi:probable F420-dependent oxidoreductase